MFHDVRFARSVVSVTHIWNTNTNTNICHVHNRNTTPQRWCLKHIKVPLNSHFLWCDSFDFRILIYFFLQCGIRIKTTCFKNVPVIVPIRTCMGLLMLSSCRVINGIINECSQIYLKVLQCLRNNIYKPQRLNGASQQIHMRPTASCYTQALRTVPWFGMWRKLVFVLQLQQFSFSKLILGEKTYF